MRRLLLACQAGVEAGVVLIAAANAAMAHHSTAIYEKTWIALEGTVLEYNYANPHATFVFRAHGPGGQTAVWRLEGLAPVLLAREEWSRDTLKSGDVLHLSIMPLRSGEKGGFWHPHAIKTRNGAVFSHSQCALSSDHCAPR